MKHRAQLRHLLPRRWLCATEVHRPRMPRCRMSRSEGLFALVEHRLRVPSDLSIKAGAGGRAALLGAPVDVAGAPDCDGYYADREYETTCQEDGTYKCHIRISGRWSEGMNVRTVASRLRLSHAVHFKPRSRLDYSSCLPRAQCRVWVISGPRPTSAKGHIQASSTQIARQVINAAFRHAARNYASHTFPMARWAICVDD